MEPVRTGVRCFRFTFANFSTDISLCKIACWLFRLFDMYTKYYVCDRELSAAVGRYFRAIEETFRAWLRWVEVKCEMPYYKYKKTNPQHSYIISYINYTNIYTDIDNVLYRIATFDSRSLNMRAIKIYKDKYDGIFPRLFVCADFTLCSSVPRYR